MYMLQIIGERINTSRKELQAAVTERNTEYITNDVKQQIEAGASYIDVNAGARIGHEREDMQWLLEVIVPMSSVPLCLDSPDPEILEMAYALVDTPPLINSISLEKERFDTMLPFLKDKVGKEDKECSIIALCMDDHGMPASSFEIYSRAKQLIEELQGIGMAQDNIYIDPLVQPISTDANKGVMVLEAVRGITTKYPAVHITGGLSNISYGLPERRMINRVFLTLMMGAGMDSAILDPLDNKIIAAIRTADMLLGKDNFCMEYLKNVRAGKIVS